MKNFSKRIMKDTVSPVVVLCLFCLILVNLIGVAHADGKPMNVRQHLPEVNDPNNNRNATKGTGTEALYSDRSSKTGGHGGYNNLSDIEEMNDGEHTSSQFDGDSEDLPSLTYHVQHPGKIKRMEN